MTCDFGHTLGQNLVGLCREMVENEGWGGGPFSKCLVSSQLQCVMSNDISYRDFVLLGLFQSWSRKEVAARFCGA